MLNNTEFKITKSGSRLNINLCLLGICFTLFTFIVAINPILLKNNILLSLQLTTAIPLFMTSIFARAKLAYTNKAEIWDRYGYITFIIAYSFLLNVVGIFLSISVGKNISLIFYACNIVSALLYSSVEISQDKARIKSRLAKDLFFIAILLFLGILPALGIY
ncbi:MAG: hypothetical protein PHC97_04170 [Patescibacteria group bacterium]|nr:hypothetical protein [Patescibacteria group bacterium]